MKKFISFILSTVLLCSLMIMGGCSDFAFNPIGEWEFSDNIIYSENSAAFSYKTSYIFEKSGTGYITVDGDRTNVTFTYEYDNENVYLTLNSAHGETSEIQKFTVSDDQKQLTNSQKFETNDENGNIVTSEWIKTLTKK